MAENERNETLKKYITDDTLTIFKFQISYFPSRFIRLMLFDHLQICTFKYAGNVAR
jgi:hypothetical protein